MKRLLSMLIFLMPMTSYGQGSTQIIGVLQKTPASTFIYSPQDTIMQGFPPAIVSLPIAIFDNSDNKLKGKHNWEFHCQSDQVKVGSGNLTPTSPPSSSILTINKFILLNFCGIKNDKGYWFHFASIANGFLYFDINTLRRVSQPINGISVEYNLGTFSNDANPKLTLNSSENIEAIFDCQSDRYFQKPKSNESFIESNIPFNHHFSHIRYSFCKGIYANLVKQEVSLSSLPSGSSLDKAKTQCTELGFKNGTEQFGKCVLQLSR